MSLYTTMTLKHHLRLLIKHPNQYLAVSPPDQNQLTQVSNESAKNGH